MEGTWRPLSEEFWDTSRQLGTASVEPHTTSDPPSACCRAQHLPSGDFFHTEGNHFLTKEQLTKKAREELKEENLEARQNATQRLRQMLLQEDNLHADTSDAFLLRFLRARKYDIERAFALVKSYYRSKVEYPAIYRNLMPSDVANVIEMGMISLLPGVDHKGQAVVMIDFGKWDTSKVSNDQYLRTIALISESLLQDECFQINGMIMIVDLGGFSTEHLRQITPAFAYRACLFLRNWCPMRFKGFFFVRENALFDIVLAIVHPFLGPKLGKRLYSLGQDLDALKEHFPVDILPISLGGTHDDTHDHENFLRHFMTQEKYFRDSNAIYGYKN